MMKIEVVSKVDEVKLEEIKHKTVIVIDALRASSTIITSLACGAKEVIPVETIGQARQFLGNSYLLAGERFGKRISGFPYTNSPTELSAAPLDGCSLVLTTTNGTRAIHKAMKADSILIGSFLNGTACAKMAAGFRKDLTILCAGSRQNFALEDGIAAGYILSVLREHIKDFCLNDLGLAMMATYEYQKDNLALVLESSATGKRLLAMGCSADVHFCAQRDTYSFVPIVRDDSIVLDFPNK